MQGRVNRTRQGFSFLEKKQNSVKYWIRSKWRKAKSLYCQQNDWEMDPLTKELGLCNALGLHNLWHNMDILEIFPKVLTG